MSKRLHEDVFGDEHQSTRADSLEAAPSPAKFQHIDSSSENEQDPEPLITCTLPPHKTPIPFTTYLAYETHYRTLHIRFCTSCSRIFPSNHYLDLHISEHHDPIADARRARGENTYGCLVEGCERLCSTPQKRRLHVLDKHDFPRDYNFWIVKWGNSGRQGVGNRVFEKETEENAKRLVLAKDKTSRRRQSTSTNATVGTVSTDGTGAMDAKSQDTPASSGSKNTEKPTAEDMDAVTTSLVKMNVGKGKVKLTFGKGQRGGFVR